MTTHVPPGTADDAVADVRAREAAHTSELAEHGQVLRLWRPPLAPGEWRTLGLFAAADRAELEQVLASMPLRVWRQDEVTELAPHPNDPATRGEPVRPQTGVPTREFFSTFVLDIPAGTAAEAIAAGRAGEAARTQELAADGQLVRLWLLAAWPDGSHALGLWRTRDETAMRALLDSLPMAPWLTEEITPLDPHPSDPAAAGSRPG
jgi:muconolactone delta-isomerase